MAIYVAMLRGINIGPHKRIKMDALRKSLEGLGFGKVKTYIQSGNVVFETGKSSAAALGSRIKNRIISDFGHSVEVMVRSREEMEKTIKDNPFLKERGIDPERLHVTFLSDAPAASGLKKLEEFTIPPDRSQCVGREIHLYFPNGVSGSSLWKAPWERELRVGSTTRNWKTVNAICQMCRDCG
jgi:uncharacterized protein (DUF1697 family)